MLAAKCKMEGGGVVVWGWKRGEPIGQMNK